MCTHYTCIYTIYTPLNTSKHPIYTLNTPLHDRLLWMVWFVGCSTTTRQTNYFTSPTYSGEGGGMGYVSGGRRKQEIIIWLYGVCKARGVCYVMLCNVRTVFSLTSFLFSSKSIFPTI